VNPDRELLPAVRPEQVKVSRGCNCSEIQFRAPGRSSERQFFAKLISNGWVRIPVRWCPFGARDRNLPAGIAPQTEFRVHLRKAKRSHTTHE